jgi:hypothetical protein
VKLLLDEGADIEQRNVVRDMSCHSAWVLRSALVTESDNSCHSFYSKQTGQKRP